MIKLIPWTMIEPSNCVPNPHTAQGIGMVPRGRLFIVGCSDGDVFAFQAKVDCASECACSNESQRQTPLQFSQMDRMERRL